MPRQPVYFAAAHQRGRADVAAGAELVNLYAQKNPQGAKAPMVLHGTPGSKLFADLDATPVRGAFPWRGRLYAVTNIGFYEVTGPGKAEKIADVNLTGPAVFAENGQVLVFVDGSRGYRFDGDTLEEIRDNGFYPAETVTFLDGYFIFNRSGRTGQFFISRLYSTDFDPLDFATAEANPDGLVAVLADHRELWCFGEKTVEVWWNSGAADFPFQRIQGAVIEHGTASPWCMAKANNTVYWLSEEGIVYHAPGGYQPQRISSHDVEWDLKRRVLGRSYAFTYVDEGHWFYQLTVDDVTWVFDVATGLWHKRRHYDHGRHHASCYAWAFNRHLIGDFSTGRLWEWDLNLAADGDRPLVAEAICAPIHRNRDRLRFKSFEVDIDTPPEDREGEVTRRSIVLALDRSGSMLNEVEPGLTRWEVLKAATISALDLLAADLSKTNLLDLLVFTWRLEQVGDPVDLQADLQAPGPDVAGGYINATKADIEAIKTWLDTQTPEESYLTNFDDAIGRCVAWFDAGLPTRTDERLLLFITDGVPDPDPAGQMATVLDVGGDIITRASGDFNETDGTVVDIYALNIDLEDTQYTEQIDNTPSDGVPVLDSTEEGAVTAVMGDIILKSGAPLRDAMALIDWSDDGGRTWSNARLVPLQKEGEYEHRLIVRRLGQSRDRRFRLRISDPVRRAILGTAYVEALP